METKYFVDDRTQDEIIRHEKNRTSVCWTLDEASEYSRIGINRLRKLSLSKDCPWVMWIVETKRIVNVSEFKKWLNNHKYIG